ncbi:MAG: hypothetical protein IJX80_01305 [Clostridia bacterium]|nr:hypothetical protein [Clostridia bacterium]
MNALLLIAATMLLSAQEIAQKEYGRRSRGGTYTYALIAVLAAIVVFLVASGGVLEFRLDVSLYAVLFALGYCTSMVMGFLAIKTGSLSLSALIMQYSLIVPAVYGMAVLGEPLKITLFIGIALLIVSLMLVNLNGKEAGVRPTLKWAVFAGLSFIGNGICATVQKVQQVDFEGEYKSEFMIVGLVITALILITLAVIFERRDLLHNVRKGGLICAGSGVSNGLCNFLIMVMAGLMPASVMYPVVSAGGTIATSLAALLIYREKMSRLQLIGLGLGVLAIVALNL